MRVTWLVVAAALLAVAAGGVFAAEIRPLQAVQPPQGGLEQVEGEVREVNLLGRTIQVDGHAGLFPRQIVLGPDAAVIMPDGRQASITSLREGDRVQATYREAGGQNVAAEVRVLYSQEQLAKPPAAPAQPAQPPQARPAQPQAPPAQAAPAPGQPGGRQPMAAPGPPRAPQ